MQHLSVYENPTLSRKNALISASDVWVLNHRDRRTRNQTAMDIPLVVRVNTDAARAERVPNASTGSETNWYSAVTQEDASTVTDLDRYLETAFALN
jgi:hypothetical protein